jgi:hypothetical protein
VTGEEDGTGELADAKGVVGKLLDRAAGADAEPQAVTSITKIAIPGGQPVILI